LQLEVVNAFRGVCSTGTGPDLARYPRLTHAPSQWGEGVRTAGTGVSCEEIAVRAQMEGLVAPLDALAATCGVTLGEVLHALDYARDQKLI
jgi:hypothetical protein